MTCRRIPCVEWSKRVSVLDLAQTPRLFTRGRHPAVYLIEHNGVPLYCGCTRQHLSVRLLAHRNEQSAAGVVMRALMGHDPSLTVRWCAGTTILEAYVIRALVPTLNKVNPASLLVPAQVHQAQIKGPHSSSRRLTQEQRNEIWRRGNAGEKRADLAKEFGVSGPAVTKICNYVPGPRAHQQTLRIVAERAAA